MPGLPLTVGRAVVEDELGSALANLVGLLEDLSFLPELQDVLL